MLKISLQQTTDTVVMILPDHFQFNSQTANTNVFQQVSDTKENQLIKQAALNEFANMATLLEKHHINVITLPSRTDVITPDAVFPNNWFSIHCDKNQQCVLVLYPMLTPNRRDERQVNELKKILSSHQIEISHVIDLTHFEKNNFALEGTGSLVLDHIHKIAFAALSPRTDAHVLQQFANKLGFLPVMFHSVDATHQAIYHTNVMMSIGTHFAVICAETIRDSIERDFVLKQLKQAEKSIMTITLDQMNQMAGNILELQSREGKPKIVMSQSAFAAFSLT
ncbi:MAG: hypothetical protein ACD_46C00103G0001, partial [uncultured bacterium]